MCWMCKMKDEIPGVPRNTRSFLIRNTAGAYFIDMQTINYSWGQGVA